MIYIHRNLWKAWILNRCFYLVVCFRMWDFFLYIICTKSNRCTKHRHTKYCSTLKKKKYFTSVTNFIALGSLMFLLYTYATAEVKISKKTDWLDSYPNVTAHHHQCLVPSTPCAWQSLKQSSLHGKVSNKGARSYFLMLLRGELETNTLVYSRHACLRKLSHETVITSLLLSSLLLLLLASHSPDSRSHWWHQGDRSTRVHAIGQRAVSNGIQNPTHT